MFGILRIDIYEIQSVNPRTLFNYECVCIDINIQLFNIQWPVNNQANTTHIPIDIPINKDISISLYPNIDIVLFCIYATKYRKAGDIVK